MKQPLVSILTFAVLLVGVIPIYAQYTEHVTDPSQARHHPRDTSLDNMNKAILEPFDQSDIVLLGKIIEIKDFESENKTEYSISVEKYLKNPKQHDLIIATGDGMAKKQNTGFNEVKYYNDPIFKKDDRVFAYLESKDGKYVVLPYSFAISKNIPTGPPPDNVWFTFYKSKFYGSEPITISGTIKKAVLYTSVAEYGSNQTGVIEIYNPERTKYLSDSLNIKPDGSFVYEFRVKGKLGISGDYEYNIFDGFGSTGSTFQYVSSPLQQFKSGIPVEQIQCKERFVVIIKASNGDPVCVKQKTGKKLLERNWIKCTGISIEGRGHPCGPHSSGALPSPIFSNQVSIPRGSDSPEQQLNVMPQTVTITLKENNTVSWINQDDVPSTLTADDNSWTTGLIKPGKSVAITFNHTGVFNYHGEPHPWKKRTVIVK